MAQNGPSFRHERRRRVRELADQGLTTKQIALLFARDYNVGRLTAFRWAHDWTLEEAAEHFNNEVADDPEHGAMHYTRLSLYETWPHGARSRPPSLPMLQAFAKLYQCAPGDLVDGEAHSDPAERAQGGMLTAGAEAAQPEEDRPGGEAPRTPTLLRVLVARRHWRTYEIFVTQYERAANELAERERDPRLRSLSVARRQFDRWLAGTLKTLPYPDHCRVLEYLFGYPINELLSPAPQASEPTQANALAASEEGGTSEAGAGPLPDSALAEVVLATRKQAGRELARHRHAAGLSQQDLANRIGYARGHVAGAETGAGRAASDFWERCDAVLAADGVLLSASHRITAAQQARARAAAQRDEAAREARLQQWRAEHSLPDNGRPTSSVNLLEQSAYSGLGSADSTSGHVEPWELTRVLERSVIGKRTLDQLEARVEGLAASYPHTPPSELRNPIFDHIEKVVGLLGGSLPVKYRRRLVIVIGELAGVAGNLLFDTKSYANARHYFDSAIVAAEEAGDYDLHAWALAMQSLVPTYIGQHREALTPIQNARQIAKGHATPSRYAWLDALAARAYAGLGDAAQCQELLRGAWQWMNDADKSRRRPGIDFFDAPRLKGFEGECSLLLKRPREAQRVLAEVLTLRDPADLKGRTLIEIGLALSHVQERDFKEACRILLHVLLIPRESLVEPIVRQVHAVRAELAPWNHAPEVKELDEQLRLAA